MRKNRVGKWYGVICSVLIVLLLVGCGGDGTSSSPATGSPETDGKSSTAMPEKPTAADTQPVQMPEAETQPAQTSTAETQPVQATAAGNQPGGAQPDASQSQPAGNQPPAAAQGQSQGISEADAKQIALQHANVSESDTSYMQVKLEREHGRDEYDVEFYAGNTEYDYEIDAVTGEILSFDYDAESYTPPAASGQAGNAAGSQNQGQTSYITPDQAKAAAFAHANVSEGDVTKLKVEFDQDHGKVEYEVEFDVGFTEYEYEIDAVTGEIISFEIDHD